MLTLKDLLQYVAWVIMFLLIVALVMLLAPPFKRARSNGGISTASPSHQFRLCDLNLIRLYH